MSRDSQLAAAVLVARLDVAALHQELVRYGLVVWTGGNVSARVAGADLMVIKPSGVDYDDLSAENMILCDLDGNPVPGAPGSERSPSSDTAAHAYVYRNLPHVGGVVHTHSTYAVAWAARGEEIPCVITGMADEFGGPIPVGPFATIGDDSIGRGIVETLRGHRSRAVLMQNHGPFTIGLTAKDAVKAAVMCEDAARTVHLARQGWPPHPDTAGSHRRSLPALSARVRAEPTDRAEATRETTMSAEAIRAGRRRPRHRARIDPDQGEPDRAGRCPCSAVAPTTGRTASRTACGPTPSTTSGRGCRPPSPISSGDVGDATTCARDDRRDGRLGDDARVSRVRRGRRAARPVPDVAEHDDRAAAAELSDVFGMNIPLRWSVAHLYQAVLDEEPHVARVDFLTTLAGYVHWRLTGRRVLGIGDASGMFPIDAATRGYAAELVRAFDGLVADKVPGLRLAELLPTVLVAGEPAGELTPEGAALLDPAAALRPGIPLCPPEGDAGTGMVATNAVAPRTGNVSAGTSIFAMVVLERPLKQVHRDVDLVSTPAGDPVAMVHCNNGASELAAWVEMFRQFAAAAGTPMDADAVVRDVLGEALGGEADAGGLLAYNHLAGEPIAGLDAGRPLFVRTPESRFTLANVMRAQLYGVFAHLEPRDAGAAGRRGRSRRGCSRTVACSGRPVWRSDCWPVRSTRPWPSGTPRRRAAPGAWRCSPPTSGTPRMSISTATWMTGSSSMPTCGSSSRTRLTWPASRHTSSVIARASPSSAPPSRRCGEPPTRQ